MARPTEHANYHTNIRVANCRGSDSHDNVPVHGECWETRGIRGGYQRIKGVREYTIVDATHRDGRLFVGSDLGLAYSAGLKPICWFCGEGI